MIQAPQVQYLPGQQQMPVSYQQPGAYTQVQQQYPQTNGYYYNYPTASFYAQPQAAKSQFNGVNIEIINPQGQGAYGMPLQMPQPVQQPVVYNMPYQMPQPAPVVYNNWTAPVQQPMAPAQEPMAAAPVQQPMAAPAQGPVTAAPVQQPIMTPAQGPAAAPQVPQPQIPAARPVVDQPVSTSNPAISPEAFAGRLRSTDADTQKAAIEEIAEIVSTNKGEAGTLLLDTQIFDELANIINKDTENLQGPTQEVIELRNKPREELTESQIKLADSDSPLEKAELNKQYALYTIAYMQKRLNDELQLANQPTLPLEKLPCIETVVNAVKSDKDPIIRTSALSALSHIAKPEYKENLTTIFELAQADEDPKVKEFATIVLEQLKNI